MEHLWYMWCLHCFGNGCEMIWDAREGGPKQHLTSAATLESETSPNQTISTDVSENKRRNFVEVFKDSVCISYISFSFIGCSHGSTHQTNPLNITTLCRDRFLCGAATGLPLSAMAAMSDVPCHFRLVQDARHQLCQVWCLPGTGLEGLELRLAQCLCLEKGGISRLVEGMFFAGTLFDGKRPYFFSRFSLNQPIVWKKRVRQLDFPRLTEHRQLLTPHEVVDDMFELLETRRSSCRQGMYMRDPHTGMWVKVCRAAVAQAWGRDVSSTPTPHNLEGIFCWTAWLHQIFTSRFWVKHPDPDILVVSIFSAKNGSHLQQRIEFPNHIINVI